MPSLSTCSYDGLDSFPPNNGVPQAGSPPLTDSPSVLPPFAEPQELHLPPPLPRARTSLCQPPSPLDCSRLPICQWFSLTSCSVCFLPFPLATCSNAPHPETGTPFTGSSLMPSRFSPVISSLERGVLVSLSDLPCYPHISMLHSSQWIPVSKSLSHLTPLHQLALLTAHSPSLSFPPLAFPSTITPQVFLTSFIVGAFFVFSLHKLCFSTPCLQVLSGSDPSAGMGSPLLIPNLHP